VNNLGHQKLGKTSERRGGMGVKEMVSSAPAPLPCLHENIMEMNIKYYEIKKCP